MFRHHSTVILRIAEAEPLVAEHRKKLDPVARLGMPAHLTLLVPFVPEAAADFRVHERAAELIANHDAFELTFGEVRSFPDTTWLAPEPAEPMVAMTRALAAGFGRKPYEGQHNSIIPHLTVGHGAAAMALRTSGTLAKGLPIVARCRYAEWWVQGKGGWRMLRRYPLLQEVASTRRIRLRTWRPATDAEAIFRVWGDAATMRYVEGKEIADVERARRGLRVGNVAQGDHGHCLWAVTLKETGEVIGDCGFSALDDRPGIELGYHLRSDMWGQGFATEAARAALGHAFQTLEVDVVHAWVHPANHGSARVLGKLGFVKGRMDAGEWHHTLKRDAWSSVA
jgi:RimJ/RimL family protein N-acetyltransferase/2'-5' RNA ligase